jgi:hypothetical protein
MVRAVIEMHQFDQLQDKIPVVPDIGEEIVDFVVIDTLKDNHVQLDRRKPCFESRFPGSGCRGLH